MKRQVIAACMIFFASASTGQKDNLKPLNIGDKVPDIEWGNFFQHTLKEKIPDLKGRLIILDFWNIYCIPCFEGMKKLDSLQRYFDKKIQIILISQNTSVEIEKVFKRIRMGYPNLPMISADTVWVKLFPHESVPHHVWIDEEGKVKFISYAYNTNASTIKAVLEGNKPGMTIKAEKKELKKEGPLFLTDPDQIKDYICYYSSIMRRIKEFGGGELKYFKDSIRNYAGIRAMNRSITSLYQEAFGNDYKYRNRIVFEVGNTDPFNLPKDTSAWDEWFDKNLYCYELIVEPGREKELHSMMKQDLNKFFPYEAVIEKRKVSSLILIRSSESDMIGSGGGEPSKQRVNDKIIIRNLPLQSLFSMIANAYADQARPVIDETNYVYNIDIEITNNLNDPDRLRKELNKYGLDLICKEKEVEMLVIRDKKKW